MAKIRKKLNRTLSTSTEPYLPDVLKNHANGNTFPDVEMRNVENLTFAILI